MENVFGFINIVLNITYLFLKVYVVNLSETAFLVIIMKVAERIFDQKSDLKYK